MTVELRAVPEPDREQACTLSLEASGALDPLTTMTAGPASRPLDYC